MKKRTKLKRVIILFCFIIMFGGKYFIPSVPGLSDTSMAVLCVFFGAMILFTTVDVVWPTFAIMAAFLTNGIYGVSQVTQNSFGNWVVIHALFVTIMTYALRKSGFAKRAAIWMITRPFALKKPRNFIILFFVSAMVIGWFIDPVSCWFVMSAMLEEIFGLTGYKKGDKFARDMMFGLLLVDSVAVAATPFSHGNAVLLTNALMSDYGISYNLFFFCVYGMLASFLFLVIYLAYFLLRKPDSGRLTDFDASQLVTSLPPMQKRERNILLIYMLGVILWVAPGILTYILPDVAAYLSSLSMLFPAVLCVLLLVLCRDEQGEPYLEVKEGLKEGAAWTVVVLMAGCMLLSSALTNSEFGIITAIAEYLEPALNGVSSLFLIFITTAGVVVLTNFTSNAIAEMLFYGLTVPLIMSGVIKGVEPMALCAMWGLACNVAVMTPVASGHAAIFAGTGWCSGGDMFKKGIPAALFGIIFYVVVAYPIAAHFL